MTLTKRKKSRLAKTNLLTSLVLILPLLVFYELGVLFADAMNGADLITKGLIRLAGVNGFVAIQLGLVAVMALLAFYLRRKQEFDLRQFLPVLLESGIYALTMGTFIIFVMRDVLGIDPQLAAGGPVARASFFDRLVMSVGAGVHEELVFRLLMMGGLLLLLEKGFKTKRWIAIAIAIAVSSLLFSAAHHIGPLGEPLRVGVFVYRAIAGVIFAFLYQYRSFAIAVYSHALYDIYVLLLV